MSNNLYTENSIETLTPLEFTRLKPGVYAGDTTYSTQLLIEVISNSIDEYRLGHGNKIEVYIEKDIVYVRDYGQGFIPGSYREDGKTIFEAAFSVLNTSGKYREDGTYEGTSLGSFGIGLKLTTFLSHKLEAETWRDGKSECIFFEEGVCTSKRVFDCAKDKHGTYVRWQPSEEFFTHTEVEINKIKNLFKTLVCLCPGLSIHLNNNGEETIFVSEKGINDIVNEAVKNNELIKNRFSLNYIDGKNRMDMVLTYANNYSLIIVPYVNTGLTESGPHITQIKTVITREFNKFFKQKKWLKEKDSNLSGEDIQEGMYIVFNITAPNVGYDAQVKSRITKIDMSPFTTALSQNLNIWLQNNEKEIKTIFNKAMGARKARDAAKRARDAARNVNKGSKKKKLLNLPTKLVDCWSKDRLQCELLIAEGK